MTNIQLWGWNKKPRTMRRFLNAGDIFCFKYHNQYGFGKLLCKSLLGHYAEIFNYFSEQPDIKEKDILKSKRLLPPLIMNTYILFDRKLEGDWRIIGKQLNFKLTQEDKELYYRWGIYPFLKISNMTEEITKDIPVSDIMNYPLQSPYIDSSLKELIDYFIKNKKLPKSFFIP